MFWRRGGALVAAGKPLMALRELPCVQKILRAKHAIPNSDTAALKGLVAQADAELSKIEGVKK